MKILNLIVARGGSKGVPRKNLLPLGDRSLIAYKAISAIKSKQCSRLIVSSESEEIQHEAQRWGAEVLFTRPAALASDTASSASVIAHTIDWIETNTTDKYDAIMLLEPSSPFATHLDLDEAAALFAARSASAVVGIKPADVSSYLVGRADQSKNLSEIMKKIADRRNVRRQDFEQEYTLNGALYLFGWDYFKKGHNIYANTENIYGHVMPREYSIEIDEPLDFNFAEFLVARGLIDMQYWRT